jgi:hypothetical protein
LRLLQCLTTVMALGALAYALPGPSWSDLGSMRNEVWGGTEGCYHEQTQYCPSDVQCEARYGPTSCPDPKHKCVVPSGDYNTDPFPPRAVNTGEEGGLETYYEVTNYECAETQSCTGYCTFVVDKYRCPTGFVTIGNVTVTASYPDGEWCAPNEE